MEAGVVIHRVPRAARVADQPSSNVRIAFGGAGQEEVDVMAEALDCAIQRFHDLRVFGERGEFSVAIRGRELTGRQQYVEAGSDAASAISDAANRWGNGADAANRWRNSVTRGFAAVLAGNAEVVRDFRVEDSGGHGDLYS
ncbi:hypothetical protein DF048_05735 [Burkholderia seminalis]|nr:hypothetical protein DF048_05735 [Burkholderia seminalis]